MTSERQRIEDLVEKLTKEFVDKGLLIEAGWIGLRMRVIAPQASDIQVEEMRMAFFAGAQHLFGSIMTLLDKDAEVTEADLSRITLISDELQSFAENFAATIKTRGSA